MSSERDHRARAAARARLERQMAARREAARRRRLLQARIAGGVAGVVLLGAVIWIVVAAVSGDDGEHDTPQASGCVSTEQFPQPTPDPAATAHPSATADPSAPVDPSATAPASPTPSPLPAGISDVGLPQADPPRSGFQVLTFETNLGTIQIEMDLSKTPCTANSMAFLASQGFYDHKGGDAPASCHRIVPDIFALQCGDPSGTGYGGPNYTFIDENLPADKLPAYHEGDVAMANSGPNTNSSQFFFVYGVSSLPGNYSLWGHVISGMDIVRQVAAGGVEQGSEMEGVGGATPATKLIFTKVTAGPITPTSSAPSPTTTPTPEATPTETPTPTTT